MEETQKAVDHPQTVGPSCLETLSMWWYEVGWRMPWHEDAITTAQPEADD